MVDRTGQPNRCGRPSRRASILRPAVHGGGRSRERSAPTRPPARTAARPRRRAARPAPPRRLAEPAHAGQGGGLQPHHGLRGLLLATPADAGNLELLVEAMGGDTTEFHSSGWRRPPDPRLSGRGHHGSPAAGPSWPRYDATSRPAPGSWSSPARQASARPPWSRAAAGQADTFVAVGHCLPLSTEVPLLPVAEALRTMNDHEDGLWLKEALADCPPFVSVHPPLAPARTDQRRVRGDGRQSPVDAAPLQRRSRPC